MVSFRLSIPRTPPGSGDFSESAAPCTCPYCSIPNHQHSRRTARRSVPTSEHDRTRRLIGLHPGFLLLNSPHPNTSEVGRFLRKRRSVHLPVLQHSKSPGTSPVRTARRSVPTSEALGSDSGAYCGLGQNDALAKEDADSTNGPIESSRLTPPYRCDLRTYRRGIAAPPAVQKAVATRRRKRGPRRTGCERSSTSRRTR